MDFALRLDGGGLLDLPEVYDEGMCHGGRWSNLLPLSFTSPMNDAIVAMRRDRETKLYTPIHEYLYMNSLDKI